MTNENKSKVTFWTLEIKWISQIMDSMKFYYKFSLDKEKFKDYKDIIYKLNNLENEKIDWEQFNFFIEILEDIKKQLWKVVKWDSINKESINFISSFISKLKEIWKK